MRPLFVFLVAFGVLPVSAQNLVCPANSAVAGKPCDVFHYHMQLYDPETKAFTTLHGINQFVDMTSCERAREAHTKQNAAVVDYVKRVKQQVFEADRLGPCHCDMTPHTSSTVYLNDAQREAQARSAETVRRRVRERLLDLAVPVDSPLLQSALRPLPVNPMLAGPRLTQLPAPVSSTVEYRATDLRMPRTAQSNTPSAAAIDLPLVDIQAGEMALAATSQPAASAAASAPTAVVVTESPAAAPPATVPSSTPPATEELVAPDATVEFPEGEQPAAVSPAGTPEAEAVTEAESRSAEDAADRFIRHETQRIQNVVDAVLDASDAIGEQVMEACMQRLQALTNLRYLILGSGSRSRLAESAYKARSESARLDFVTRMFGEDVATHWMPRLTSDVIIEPVPQIDEQPEPVLRDGSGTYSNLQRKRALYVILSRAPITEEQQLWLIPAIEEFLQ